MILGTGIDVVRSDRIARIWHRFGERFVERILTPAERCEWMDARRSPQLLAKRFAVKEAAAKALGTGFREGISYRDISVVHDALGAPELRFSGAAGNRSCRLGVVRQHLSISDDHGLAVAMVVLEGAPDQEVSRR